MTALGGDQNAAGVAGVGGQRLGDEPLVVTGLPGVQVVRVRGIDQRDARVQRRVDGPDGPVLVRPALDRHRHATEADGADRHGTDAPGLHESSSLPLRGHLPGAPVRLVAANLGLLSSFV
jgi:hypothetical protein